MALAPPPATAQPAELEAAPLLLPWDLRLTPEQFERVCQANPEAVLELAADGHLIVMTPTGGETSSRNSRLLIQLGIALSRSKRNLGIFDSSAGFLLPDGSVLSPGAALLLHERWLALTPPAPPQLPAARWLNTRPMAPGWVGCSFPRSGRSNSGGAASRALPSGWRTPVGWRGGGG